MATCVYNINPKYALILCLISATACHSQNKSGLQGRWEVVALSQFAFSSNDHLYYDLEKDSIYIPAKDMKESYKDGHDSIFTINLFKGMYKSFKGASFTFQKDSLTFDTGSGQMKGIYTEKGKDSIAIAFMDDGKIQPHQTYSYRFKDGLLYISSPIDIGYMQFILKKE